MFSLRTVGIVVLLGFLWTTHCTSAQGAEWPSIAAPRAYVGEFRQENTSWRTLLYLGESQEFFLREESNHGTSKASSWETTGKWYQIREGSFLQLANNSGLYRLLNVGGTGNLYFGMQLSDGKQQTIVLRPRPLALPEYSISGILRTKGNELFLENFESLVTHKIIPESAVTDFVKEHPLDTDTPMHVQAQVLVAKERNSSPALRIKSIQSIPVKKRAPHATPGYFQDAVAATRWKLTRIDQKTPDADCLVSFLPDRGKYSGKIEIFTDNSRVTGVYTLQGEGIFLSVADKGPHFAALVSHTRFWRLVGDVLELWDEKDLLALLEKIR